MDTLRLLIIDTSKYGVCAGCGQEHPDPHSDGCPVAPTTPGWLCESDRAKLLGPAVCKVCGSAELTWHCHTENQGGAADGRLRMHEIGVLFVLGCDMCSETLSIVRAENVADMLTQAHRMTHEKPAG